MMIFNFINIENMQLKFIISINEEDSINFIENYL